jgi:predicted nuclease of predicted toxin-antitoxin system
VAQLYADEHVPTAVTDALRSLGHDVVTIQDDGRANQKLSDADVLARATALGRAVVTNNRKDYHRLHRHTATHAGIITYTDDHSDRAALAARIDAAVTAVPDLTGQLVRVYRPNTPPPKLP